MRNQSALPDSRWTRDKEKLKLYHYPPSLSLPSTEQILIYDLIPQGDNTFKPVVRPRDRHARITKRALRSLGIWLSYATLRRLGQAGFIQVAQVARGAYKLDLPSYYEHLRRVEADENFWQRTIEVRDANGNVRRITNAQRYREAALLCERLNQRKTSPGR